MGRGKCTGKDLVLARLLNLTRSRVWWQSGICRGALRQPWLDRNSRCGNTEYSLLRLARQHQGVVQLLLVTAKENVGVPREAG